LSREQAEEGDAMKRALIVICAFLTLGCAASGARISPDGGKMSPEIARLADEKPNITVQMIAPGPPEEGYCNVVVPPNPILVGGWMTRVEDNRPVEFWLTRKHGQYALYFLFRDDGTYKDKPFSEWYPANIAGDDIYSPGRAFHFYTEDGRVYYKYKGGKPWEMKRFEPK
jgi:hypothetical protein